MVNPWNFYSLFNADDEIYCDWLRNQGLLATTLICANRERGAPCGGLMTLKVRSERKGNQIFRCTKNRNHVKTMMANSFFEKTRLEIQDVMVFIKSYLDKNTLLQCANFSGICYKSIAVDWASYIREMFKEHFHRHIRQKVLGGIVEIDESLFGRRVKYHKGNPNKGMKVWIFGLVDREANTVILYPVSDRTKETLLPLIQRHVAQGSTIYSDGWSAYLDLNDMGYRHFTVLHKYTFRKDYIDVETGAKTTVHTNRIEGAWKHAKDHFRRIVGTKSGQFEGHLAEIMWRSEAKGDIYGRFFQLMRECWTLDKPVEYNYTTPLFDSWEGPPTAHQRDQVVPIESGAETSESEMGDAEQGPSHQPVARPIFHVGETETTVSSSDDEDTSLDRTITNTDVQTLRNSSTSTSHQSTLSPEKLSTERYTTKVVTGETISTTSHQMLRQPTPQTSRLSIASPSSSAEKGANIQTTKKGPIRNKTKNVCHPVGFKEARSEQSKSHKHAIDE